MAMGSSKLPSGDWSVPQASSTPTAPSCRIAAYEAYYTGAARYAAYNLVAGREPGIVTLVKAGFAPGQDSSSIKTGRHQPRLLHPRFDTDFCGKI